MYTRLILGIFPFLLNTFLKFQGEAEQLCGYHSPSWQGGDLLILVVKRHTPGAKILGEYPRPPGGTSSHTNHFYIIKTGFMCNKDVCVSYVFGQMPHPRKEKFGKRCTKPHPVPWGGSGAFHWYLHYAFHLRPPYRWNPAYTMCYYIASQLACVVCNISILYPSNWYVLLAFSLKAAVWGYCCTDAPEWIMLLLVCRLGLLV